MPEQNSLPIPSTAESDPNSFELLRVWVANKGQHVSLRSGVWEDAAAWGIMLVDLAKHIARTFEQEQGRDPNQVLLRIKQGFDVEWKSATGGVSGKLSR